MESEVRPLLPPGIAYRYGLGLIVGLFLMIELLFVGATIGNHRNGSDWAYLWGCGAFLLLIGTLGRLLWLDRHGWWQRRALPIPDLPFESRGLDWRITFETDRVIRHGGQLSGPARVIRYAEIKRVEIGARSALQIAVSGKPPLLLPTIHNQFLLIALLAHHAPEAEFAGITAMMRVGWEPRC